MRKGKIKVLIISGGPSSEREISLKTGEQITKFLPPEKYDPYLIEITSEGKWLLRRNASGPSAAKELSLKKYGFELFDVAFIGIHGKFGEDGTIQSFLETVGIPYTGSGVLASALGMNKLKTLEFVSKNNIHTPAFLSAALPLSLPLLQKLHKDIQKDIGYPCVIKPNQAGSSIGISIVKKPTDLDRALEIASKEDRTIIVEEYISGTELTCAVMGNTAQTKLVALPPIEIIPEGEFFDYDSKYFSKITQEICPARIDKRATKELQNTASKVHELLGCDGLTRSDFILTKGGKLYFLEINTIPGLTENSLSPKEAAVAGFSFGEFLDKQLELALLRFPPDPSRIRTEKKTKK